MATPERLGARALPGETVGSEGDSALACYGACPRVGQGVDQGQIHSVMDILDRLDQTAQDQNAQGNGRVTGQQIVHAFGSRSYGPFLLLPSLFEISPLGGLPGVASSMALVVVLVAGQMALGQRCCWLPRFITQRSIASAKLRWAIERLRPLARWLDRWFHGRLRQLTRGPFVRVAAIACTLLALLVPFLEVVPFASTAPMGAIALFGLALLVHDGALMIAASAAAVGAFALVAAIA